MAEEATRPRLGRGLAALIGEVGDEMSVLDRSRGQRRVPVEFLRPNPRNPRKAFAEADLEELSASIRERGVIQPIVVRPAPGLSDAYEIIAGERRWRASQRAGLHEVPVVVLEVDDRTSLEYAIVENVQRADLNPIEEAGGYERLINEFSYSQSDLATIIGKSRSHVANTLRLLKLPSNIQTMLSQGELTAGHARALLSVSDPEGVARRIVEKGLNVRDVERIAREEDAGEVKSVPEARARREKDPDTRALEQALEDVLGLTVAIDHRGTAGELRIRYNNLEQLDALCRRLKALTGR
ncbi:ParB/RepB/Spo0J family partition protein [Salinarimonas soli]|uniref:ParB/RepB/Spo0J family partition protein n=1 Tax=Salinarimonas soli TaxID=1638099 RepID=A0A5B2VFE7_9HYPH|nr:ParB/RepB/Spo0J family partition protein [Salinarimonas soli]KAA2237841.1 ParB/RepB/Spo0J family partition protein [Salinarimonas soli]